MKKTNNLKTIEVDARKLSRLRRLLGVATDEEAAQIAIKRTLAARDAIEWARKLRERGTFWSDWDEVQKRRRKRNAHTARASRNA